MALASLEQGNIFDPTEGLTAVLKAEAMPLNKDVRPSEASPKLTGVYPMIGKAAAPGEILADKRG